ncbi:MAG: hypothetical protein JWR47_3761 [Phenylobacterium sp.]|nr:hypothetical protein [Phenylobacterium sp.]
MAYGQVDPARLQGEALSRWYLRSPADIEQERQERAAKAHEDFFASSGPGLPAISPMQDGAANGDGIVWPSADQNYGRGETAPQGNADRQDAQESYQATFQPTDQGAQRIQVSSNPWNCPTCHGVVPPPISLPPPTLPFPWSGISMFRDGSASPPPQSGRDDRKQCEMQDRNDRGICVQQPTNRAKAVCHKTATTRREYCDATGIIGEPDLFTARRKSGRRWP